MREGRALPDLFMEVKNRAMAKRDIIIPARDIIVNNDLSLDMGKGGVYTPNRHLMGQMRADLNDAFKFELRAPFWDSTAQQIVPGQGNLLTTILNTYLPQTEDTKLVRCYDYKYAEVPGRDNVARAWLSDKYYRLDYEDLLQSVIPLLLPMYEQGKLLFRSCEVTDTKLYVKFTVPSLRREVRLSPKVGEVVDFGGILSTSEVGQGYNEAVLFYEILTCENGAKATKYGNIRRHTGKRISAAEERNYSERTISLDDQAFWAKFADDTQALLNGVYAERMVADMERAAGFEIPHAGNAVEFLKQKWGMTIEQSDSVLNYFSKGDHGGMTLYGLSNAVTRAAEDQEDYDLATLFEERGADLLTTWTRGDLKELAKES